ncbi:hypothetical protein ASPCAL06890 [Aspergillus calidoustus]|uniref:DUF7726 domain-containing protein n=1 Tax=Aspergillus calidoustus TaxID=454130 RepID=A0A0U5G855_ASPCI|nr:hypothetical protein ASPCAL06890 [Aspergillus calidoustus]
MGLTNDEKLRKALRELDHNGLILTPEVARKLIAGEKLTEEEAPGTTKPKPKPKPKATSASQKRKAAAVETVDLTTDSTGNAALEETSDKASSLSDIDSDDERLDEIKWDCNQIRRKVTALIDSKQMKVADFLRAANLTSRAYYVFMKQNGKHAGQRSSVYVGAHRFFLKREILGMNRKKVSAPSKKARLDAEAMYNVRAITLEGEEEGNVPVYDTCDEIRKKIRACLQDSGMTKTAFCREISKTPIRDQYGHVGLRTTSPLQTATLTSFLSKKGPKEGNQSMIFYAAYVFFEKLWVRDGKPKTEFREEMEDVWGSDGFDRATGPNAVYITAAGRTLYTDEYGRVRSGPIGSVW